MRNRAAVIMATTHRKRGARKHTRLPPALPVVGVGEGARAVLYAHACMRAHTLVERPLHLPAKPFASAPKITHLLGWRGLRWGEIGGASFKAFQGRPQPVSACGAFELHP